MVDSEIISVEIDTFTAHSSSSSSKGPPELQPKAKEKQGVRVVTAVTAIIINMHLHGEYKNIINVTKLQSSKRQCGAYGKRENILLSKTKNAVKKLLF